MPRSSRNKNKHSGRRRGRHVDQNNAQNDNARNENIQNEIAEAAQHHLWDYEVNYVESLNNRELNILLAQARPDNDDSDYNYDNGPRVNYYRRRVERRENVMVGLWTMVCFSICVLFSAFVVPMIDAELGWQVPANLMLMALAGMWIVFVFLACVYMC